MPLKGGFKGEHILDVPRIFSQLFSQDSFLFYVSAYGAGRFLWRGLILWPNPLWRRPSVLYWCLRPPTLTQSDPTAEIALSFFSPKILLCLCIWNDMLWRPICEMVKLTPPTRTHAHMTCWVSRSTDSIISFFFSDIFSEAQSWRAFEWHAWQGRVSPWEEEIRSIISWARALSPALIK